MKLIQFSGKWLAWSQAMEAKRKKVLAEMKKNPRDAKRLEEAFMKVFKPEYAKLKTEEAKLLNEAGTSTKKAEAFLAKNKKSLSRRGQANLKKAVTQLKESLKALGGWLKRKP